MAIRNYLKVFADGHTEATKFRPLFQQGERERAYAGENPDVLVDGKWFNSTNGGEKVVNGTFDTALSGWSIGGSGTVWESGTIKVIGSSLLETQTIAVSIGIEYNFSLDVTTIGAGIAQYRLYDGNENTIFINEQGSFIAQTNTIEVRLGNGGSTNAANATYYDNISVYETEIIPDIVYPTQFSYMAKDDKLASFLIEGGQPVDVTYEYDSPSIVQNVIQAKDMVVVDKLKINNTEWLNDGVDYDDPDAIGANPVAKIYPDGTIVGSTDNGGYTKYPNGDLVCFMTYSTTTYSIGVNQKLGIIQSLPCAFMDTKYTPSAVTTAPTGTSDFYGYIYEDVNSRTITSFSAVFRNGATAQSIQGFNWSAIGRWKS